MIRVVKETLCIIPARGGSKGIPRKNTRMFGGAPLIAHTIRQALRLKRHGLINRIVVSTEDKTIARIGKKEGGEIPFLRPRAMAQDTSPIKEAVVYTLKRLRREEGYQPEYILLLQTTSPLRTDEDITRHFKEFDPKTMDAIVTVCPTHHLLFYLGSRNKLIVGNKSVPQKADNARQLFQKGFKLNGCFAYLIKTKTFLHERTFFPRRTHAVVVPAWRSIDLDHPEDFVLAETIFTNRASIEKKIKKIGKEQV